ncbi:MAG: FHA domain-containing protein [Anaerolineae bacterium]|jgi:hypothetical protein
MTGHNWIEIVDRQGWRKEFALQKRLTHIGSEAGNDIVLEGWRGGGVAQRHLQLIAAPGAGGLYRAINLSESDVALGDGGTQLLRPRSTAEIGHGDRIRLGDFLLVFHLAGAPEAAQAVPVAHEDECADALPLSGDFERDRAAPHIGLNLSLPDPRLHPGQPVNGVVTVCNKGDAPGAQFQLEVAGLDPDSYEIWPGLILFPNVEKGVDLRLHHPRRPEPPAGQHRIQVRASAPEAYPGEVAIVSGTIQILPYYHHSLSLVRED